MPGQPFPRRFLESYAVNAEAEPDPLHLCQLCHTQPTEMEVYTEDMPPALGILPAHVQPLLVCQACHDDPQWFRRE